MRFSSQLTSFALLILLGCLKEIQSVTEQEVGKGKVLAISQGLSLISLLI